MRGSLKESIGFYGIPKLLARTRPPRAGAVAVRLILAALLCLPASVAPAQKQGGTLNIYHRDSPGSLSIHEQGTISAILPMMGVFNNLVMYDQQLGHMVILLDLLPLLGQKLEKHVTRE